MKEATYRRLSQLRSQYPRLPVSLSTQEKLRHTPFVDPQPLSRWITQDPLRTTVALMYIHSTLSQRTEQITTIQQGITLLGVEKIQTHYLACPSIALTPEQNQLISHAYNAAAQTQALAEARFDIRPNELHSAALFFWIPELLAHTPLAWLNDTSDRDTPENTADEEQEDWIELRSFLSNFWGLSPCYSQLFHPGNLQHPRTQTLCYGIMLSLCAWRHHTPTEQWIDQIASTLRISIDKLQSILKTHSPKYADNTSGEDNSS